MPTYSFAADLWVYSGEAAWHFVTLPEDIASEIKDISAPHRKGFGSVRVIAKIGESEWRTSLFPDTKTKSYLLPIKKAVRIENHLREGDTLSVTLTLDV